MSSAPRSKRTSKRAPTAFGVLSIMLGGVAAALLAAQPAEQRLPQDAVLVVDIAQPAAHHWKRCEAQGFHRVSDPRITRVDTDSLNPCNPCNPWIE